MTECFRILIATLILILWGMASLILVCSIIGLIVVLDETWLDIGLEMVETVRGK